MAAIGDGWADGAYASTSWASSAWQTGVIVFTVAIERIQAVAKALRVQIIGL